MLCYFLSILSLSKSNVTVNACAMEAGKELSKPMKLCIYWFHRLPPGFKDFSVVRSGLSPIRICCLLSLHACASLLCTQQCLSPLETNRTLAGGQLMASCLSGSLASQCLLLPPYRRGSPCSDWFQMKWVLAWVCWFPSLPGLASGGAGTAKPYVWQFRSRCGVHVCQI